MDWIAVARHVRELMLDLAYLGPVILPRSLYSCGTLKTLKLKNVILRDVPSPICFQSLRTLHLLYVRYPGNEFVHRLLSNCPVLEDLTVKRRRDDNVTTFSIVVPSLQRLYIKKSWHYILNGPNRLVIEAPLKCLIMKGCCLPSSLYTCETLEVLKLQSTILVDVPSLVCFRSLKTLHLRYLKYLIGESLSKLLSGCPILEDLVLDRCFCQKMMTLTVAVPSLRRLSIEKSLDHSSYGIIELVIDAPSLKYLKIVDWCTSLSSIKKMPELVEANVKVLHTDAEKLPGSLTSVTHLSLYLFTSMALRPTGSIFSRLVNLELFTCGSACGKIISRMLKDSPELRVLKLNKVCNLPHRASMTPWTQPSPVPSGLRLHLETFEWRRYQGTATEKKVAKYILKNAVLLKTATIYVSTDFGTAQVKHEILEELASMCRGSTSCRLTFD